MPVFDAGNRQAVVDERRAEWQALGYEYSQQWQQAVFEVEQALINEQQHSQNFISLQQQLQLARKTQNFKKIAYLNGSARYLQLLQAQESTLKLERQLIEAHSLQISSRVALYRAISHGNFDSIPAEAYHHE
jgi:outer membrane protein TolC